MLARAFTVAVLVGLAAVSTAQAQGLSEGQARQVFIDGGCSNVGNLSRDTAGVWHGTCQGVPFPTRKMVGTDGKLVAAGAFAGMSESEARHKFIDGGCSNAGNLSRDSSGMWHATCQGVPFPTRKAIDASGKMVAAPAFAGVSEGQARHALIDAGCSNVGAIGEDGTGIWHATCQATPFPKQMKVGTDGKAVADVR